MDTKTLFTTFPPTISRAQDRKTPDDPGKELPFEDGVTLSGAGIVAGAPTVHQGQMPLFSLGLSELADSRPHYPSSYDLTNIIAVAATVSAVGGLLGPAGAKAFLETYQEEAGRARRGDGRFVQKRGDTQLATLRETYGMNFAAGLPGNMPLQVLRAATGMSLTQLVENPKAVAQAAPDLADWKAPEPAPGGRERIANGRIRAKNGTTHVSTLRTTYGDQFADGVPEKVALSVLRNATGKSLSEMVDDPESIRKAMPKIAMEALKSDRRETLKDF